MTLGILTGVLLQRGKLEIPELALTNLETLGKKEKKREREEEEEEGERRDFAEVNEKLGT